MATDKEASKPGTGPKPKMMDGSAGRNKVLKPGLNVAKGNGGEVTK